MYVMMVYQPIFVLLPVSFIGPWYSEKKKRLAGTGRSESGFKQEQEGSRPDCCGIAALIALTASTASAIALTQDVKTATFVNPLAKNVTNVKSY